MIVLNDRLKIFKGEDKSPVFKLRGSKSNDPIDLTNATNITIEFKKANRSKLSLDMATIPAVKAYYELDESVKVVADNAGTSGNDIILSFDGIDDLQTVVDAWNTANPLNTVSHNGTGTEIYDLGQVRLSGGLNSYEAVSIDGDPLLGRVKVIMLETETILLKRGDNQSVKIIVDFGEQPAGTRKIAIFDNKLDVVDR